MRTSVIVLGVVAAAVVFACGSFDEASDASSSSSSGSPADSGTVDGGGGGTNDGATKGGCPDPLPPNAKCWNFDDGVLPGPDVKNGGELKLDETIFHSAGRSLVASTPMLAAETTAFARFVQALDSGAHVVTFEQWVHAATKETMEVGDVVIDGTASSYEVHFLIEGGTVSISEVTFQNGTAVFYEQYALGSLVGDWTKISFRVELLDFPGANAQRHLIGTMNDVKTLDDKRATKLEMVKPAQVYARVGITYVVTDADPGAARDAHVDDVLVSWSP